MALFKKKIEDKDSKDIPDFPSSFAPDIRFPEFPGYGQDTNPFREPPKSFESLKPIPKEDKYESLLDQPLSPQMQPPLNKPMNMQPRYQFQEMPQKSFGMVKDEQRQVFHEDKPIFVKIDDYEEAIYTLDKIKSKLKEVSSNISASGRKDTFVPLLGVFPITTNSVEGFPLSYFCW